MLKLSAVLLCLVLISAHFTSGLFAKYSSSAAADDSARVASFVIETDLDRIELDVAGEPILALGGTDEVQSVALPFYIKSGSEVTIGYSVTVDFGSVLPEYMNIQLSNGKDSLTLAADGNNANFVFSDFGTLAPGAIEQQKAELKLTISVSDLSAITEQLSIPAATLTVRVYQVD